MIVQTAPSPSVVGIILQAVIGIVVPMVATYAATAVTKVTTLVNGFRDWEKRVLVTVYAVIIAGIGHALGIHLPDAWGSLGAPEIQAILAAAGAMLLHRLTRGAS